MTEPRTEAGRTLLEEWFPGGGHGLDIAEMEEFRDAISAIEAEAAALAAEPDDWLRAAAQTLLDRFDAHGIWHDVALEDVAEAAYALHDALAAEPEPVALDVERRKRIDEHLVPWFKVRGDDSLDEGIMRRCLLCGRTSRIVSSTASPSGLEHVADCAVLALAAALDAKP